MTIEGYFDGTAVRLLEPVDLKPQQKVFIHIPAEPSTETKEERKQRQLEAIHGLFGLLTKEEAAAVEESISAGIRLKEVEL